jgi:O-antigen/teichoic acid export membrane protein
LAGILARLGIGFISLPIFTRVFSVADYGLIDFAGKILLLLTALSKMGLQNSALRFFDQKAFASDPQSSRRYYSTMFLGGILTSVIVAILFRAVSETFVRSRIDAPLAGLFGFVSLLVVLRAMQSMLWSFLRIEERTKAYNVSIVAMKVATIVTVCLFLPWCGRSARTYFLGATAAELAIVAGLSWLVFPRGILNPSQFQPALFRAGLAFGGPLILYELSSIVLDVGDRVLVRHYLGAGPLGLYSVAYGLSAQVNELLIVPLNLAIFPIYMRLWTLEGREATVRFLSVSLDLFLLVAAAIGALAAVTARDGLILLASAKYAGAERLIPLIVVGLLIYTAHIFLCAGLLIHRKTGTMAGVLLCSAAVNITLNCVLLPRLGLVGAAIATVVSYAFCVLLLASVSFRFLPLNIRFRALSKYLFVAAVIAVLVSRIELTPRILNVAVRSALTLGLYGSLICCLDTRVRCTAARALRRFSKIVDFNAVPVEVPSPPD